MSDMQISSATANPTLNQASGGQAIRALRGAQNNSPDPHRIDKAARDFESILVGQWLEKAEKSFASLPGKDPDQDNDSTHDNFQSIACQSLAQGLSKTGGFGIAAMLSKHLQAEAKREQKQASSVTDNQSPDEKSSNSFTIKGLQGR